MPVLSAKALEARGHRHCHPLSRKDSVPFRGVP